MSLSQYSDIKISIEDAKFISQSLFNIQGEVSELHGELDFNFKLNTGDKNFILKITRPGADQAFVEFQTDLLEHISKHDDVIIEFPRPVKNINEKTVSKYRDQNGQIRFVRLLSWIEGRLWSNVNPHTEELFYSLGKTSGLLTKYFEDYNHPVAHRKFDWDITQAEWTLLHSELFDEETKKMIAHFQNRFLEILPELKLLRMSVIHNDINDHNIIVTESKEKPAVKAIIDFGDAIYSAQVNNLAVTIAYAVMSKPDPLQAAVALIKGYHEISPLNEDELKLLYVLVAIRLVLSLTKSALNKKAEPENNYLLVSEKSAMELLSKWYNINEQLAIYSFRNACGFQSHPHANDFSRWVKDHAGGLRKLFPKLDADKICPVDMSVSSTWLGSKKDYSNNYLTTLKLNELRNAHPGSLVAGGYGEIRPFYSADIFKKEGNNGPEYRTVHLGIDIWVEKNTPVHALFEGKVYSIHNNEGNKDYGPTLILEHTYLNDQKFYTLYGHLSVNSLGLYKTGDLINKGDTIAFVGDMSENGNWSPHLHFQLMLEMLGNTVDFPGVAFPSEFEVWKSICPNPNILLQTNGPEASFVKSISESIAYRQEHLGKNLSVSYEKPLKMVRGEGVCLIDETGRKYLDTVNNVAHVGHEHYRVVEAGQKQMAILNTNTRYLHENINDFAKQLLKTFPKELSVVYFVNSGSEANELALRMAKTFTGQKDMIAVEMGYHGNTNACIEVSSYKFNGAGGTGCPDHTHILPLPDTFRGIYQGEGAGDKYANHVHIQLENIRNNGRKVAAFICESIISCGGQIELPANYLKIVYKAVREAGGICIADEVQVGCGRVGSSFWGFQLHHVIPDIVTIGKPIGNGHPLAAVVCTKQIADAFANGMEYFNTFGGNPVSCAIGNEVLKVIEDENLQENALMVGNYLKEQLKALQKDFQIIGDVRGQGLFLGFELNGKDKKPLGNKASYLANRMRDFAILMSTDGTDHNVIKIKPPIVFSKENADELISRLSMVLKEDFMQVLN